MENLYADKFYTKLSSLLLEFKSEYYEKIISEILKSQDYQDEPKRFFYIVIQKMVGSLEASNIFIRNFETKRNLHPSLFIILRSVVADFIVAEFVIKIGKTDEGMENLINGINFDHIHFLKESVKNTASKVFNWDEQEVQNKIDAIENKSKFYDSNKQPLTTRISSSPYGLIRRIFNESSSKDDMKPLRLAFNIYDTYSKLEHLGEFSFMLIHRGYDDKSQLEIRYDLYDTIRIMIAALNNYAQNWESIWEKHSEFFKKLEEEIALMLPDKIQD